MDRDKDEKSTTAAYRREMGSESLFIKLAPSQELDDQQS